MIKIQVKSVQWVPLAVTAGILGLSAHTAVAGIMGEATMNYQPLVTFTAGADVMQQPSAQYVTLYPPFQNYYTVSGSNNTAFDGGIFLGMEKIFTDRFFAQLGIAAYCNTNININGDVWQFGLPIFDNLNYSYQVQSSRFMMSGKWLSRIPQHDRVHPYLSGEIGVAVNRASGYSETSFTPGVPPMAPFGSNSQTSFAYGVGMGLDYDLTQNVRLGCGYQFADLGSASLGTTLAQVTSNTLSQSNLHTNQLRFQLSGLF